MGERATIFGRRCGGWNRFFRYSARGKNTALRPHIGRNFVVTKEHKINKWRKICESATLKSIERRRSIFFFLNAPTDCCLLVFREVRYSRAICEPNSFRFCSQKFICFRLRLLLCGATTEHTWNITSNYTHHMWCGLLIRIGQKYIKFKIAQSLRFATYSTDGRYLQPEHTIHSSCAWRNRSRTKIPTEAHEPSHTTLFCCGSCFEGTIWVVEQNTYLGFFPSPRTRWNKNGTADGHFVVCQFMP